MTGEAVVTGASGGMGAAVCALLIREGWDVHAWDISPGDATGVRWRQVDVADPTSVDAAARAVTRCDLLFNGAGVALMAPAAELTPELWSRVLDINLTGTFLCCRALYGALVSARGVAINVASTRAFQSARGRAAYAVSKAGVVMLTKTLGLEWAAEGVRVVAIAPGYIRTPMVQQQLDLGGLRRDVILEHTPLSRIAEPHEIAELALALAGRTFSFMTGTTLVFDGGWLANSPL